MVNGLKKCVFPGAAVGLYHDGQVESTFIRVYGRTRNDEKGVAVVPETLFDLASLTKPLCTALGVLCLLQEGKIRLESRLAEVCNYTLRPEFKDTTIRQLLSHSSGLPGYKPLYASFAPVVNKENKAGILKAILKEKLAYGPGTKCVYSDLGFILLGEVIETVGGQPLDVFFRRRITGPLGLEKQIYFRPVSLFAGREANNIAATEECPWRGRLMQGEVHDEHSWLMNGVAGHAGLFGTIGGVLSLVGHLLRQWRGKASHPEFSGYLLGQALTRQYADQTWCLGFDTPSSGHSSAGRYFSPHSAGHLGYTGTSFWMDPDRGLAVVLLSNRVHPTRTNERIKRFRPLLHDKVVEAVDGK
ncbi:MAG: serine hydrolase [Desulfobulbaceae bacterium]|nr:serine hydrolase [Desulfobulbaceae bacterium]